MVGPKRISPATSESEVTPDEDVEARRRFLKLCGKYAAAMPPAIVLLLSASEETHAGPFGSAFR